MWFNTKQSAVLDKIEALKGNLSLEIERLRVKIDALENHLKNLRGVVNRKLGNSEELESNHTPDKSKYLDGLDILRGIQ